ncbi:MAG: ATP-binding cassette domain-containing protein [Candidatus Nezhaarchaeales archaeon]
MLEVKELTVAVENNIVVKRVSLKVVEGKVNVLMGPNASGKTTLLKAIMGLPGYRIVSGKIVFNGKDITKDPPWIRARKGVGLAFQSLPKIHVEIGHLARAISEKHSTTELIEYASEKLYLKHLLKRKLGEGLSGGEMKRVELFTVVLQRPRIALLDEPDSGVDVESIRMIADVINRIVEENVGVLLVTHQGHILRYLKNLYKAYVMVSGEIVYEGDVEEVYNKVLSSGYSYFKRERGGKERGRS